MSTPGRSRTFVLGGNAPWLDCGWDFGPSRLGWQRAPRDWESITRDLRRLRALGIRVVRWWVLAGGVNYPPRGGSMLSTDFQADFAALCEACQRAGVQLVPSLLSFEWFLPARGESRGRADLVFGQDARGTDAAIARFLDLTLAPLLTVSADRPDAIFAWEIINEPDWATRGGPRLGPAGRASRVPAASMGALIDQGVQRACEAGFVATVGFKDMRVPWLPVSVRTRLRRLAGHGQYVHQGHHYPNLLGDWLLAPARLSPIRPVILGEFPTAQGRWPRLGSRVGRVGQNIPWLDPELRASEPDARRYLRGRIALIRQRGYAGAWLWATPLERTRMAADGRSLGEAEVRRQLAALRAAGLHA